MGFRGVEADVGLGAMQGMDISAVGMSVKWEGAVGGKGEGMSARSAEWRVACLTSATWVLLCLRTVLLQPKGGSWAYAGRFAARPNSQQLEDLCRDSMTKLRLLGDEVSSKS